MAEAVKEGQADACISAGNTGALMSAGLFKVGRIKGIERPALSPTLPTVNGGGFYSWMSEPTSMRNQIICCNTE